MSMVEARLATFAADSQKAQARLAELEAQSSALQGEVREGVVDGGGVEVEKVSRVLNYGHDCRFKGESLRLTPPHNSGHDCRFKGESLRLTPHI